MFKRFTKKEEEKTQIITLVSDSYRIVLLNGDVVTFVSNYCHNNSWMYKDYRFEQNYCIAGKVYPRSAILYIEEIKEEQIERTFEIPKDAVYYNGLYEGMVYGERLTPKELQEKIESGEFKEVE